MKLASEYDGECFSNSFDRRTFNLSPEHKRKRQYSRLGKVLGVEYGAGAHFDLKDAWHRKASIYRRRYGSLLSKNCLALPTQLSGPRGQSQAEACLPGPGGHSGMRFVSGTLGGSLGGSSAPSTAGVLADEFDATVDNYKENLVGRPVSYRRIKNERSRYSRTYKKREIIM